MAVIDRGNNPEHFQKIMGRGGVISSIQRPEKQEIEPLEVDSDKKDRDPATTDSGTDFK